MSVECPHGVHVRSGGAERYCDECQAEMAALPHCDNCGSAAVTFALPTDPPVNFCAPCGRLTVDIGRIVARKEAGKAPPAVQCWDGVEAL
jgi:hypothetical protein